MKKLTNHESAPVTVRLTRDDIQSIDDWRREFPSIPTRGDFLRLAVQEKLSRDAQQKRKLETSSRSVRAIDKNLHVA